MKKLRTEPVKGFSMGVTFVNWQPVASIPPVTQPMAQDGSSPTDGCATTRVARRETKRTINCIVDAVVDGILCVVGRKEVSFKVSRD